MLFAVGCNRAAETNIVGASDENLKLDNGVLLYKQKPFNGVLLENFTTEIIKSRTEYLNGKKHGNEQQWYTNGSQLSERFYSEGFKVGVHKSWWSSGNLKFEYHFNDKGEFHGAVKEWYESGQVFQDFNYKEGKEAGKQRMWKPDGSIKANYEVVGGDRFGLIGLKKCYTVTVDKDEIE
ncbi:hypothetical protein EYD45_05880 [Hyunsoonleella flava]|uniref:Toxin-antitoxin system YwqK family antitoxin n=1 Tax=Hyunsoonleella flava TaxID=2527939 RepID=A0A4Q9FKG3_9FLAO|nr:hypothetical protein [Hyunsoonleella flava]TBN04788.1 hypothetical protein EYD45_05880 [Hyunsoonleella flava]